MDTKYSLDQTAQIAHAFLEHILVHNGSATVVGLSGDLGAGKTTLVQAVARELGVQEQVVSPTFVIAKFYETTDTRWQKLIHIDAYRIDDIAELKTLGFENMLALPNTLIIIEWPERVRQILPSTTTFFEISHKGEDRHIAIV